MAGAKGSLLRAAAAATGSELSLDEVAAALESHEQEMRQKFDGWASEMQRMQREHVRPLAELAERLRAGPTSPKQDGVQPEVVKASLPPGTPPVVAALAWSDPNTPAASAFESPQPSPSSGSMLRRSVRRRTTFGATPRVQPPPAREFVCSRCRGTVSWPEAEQRMETVPSAGHEVRSIPSVGACPTVQPVRSSRFAEPLKLLYGTERISAKEKSNSTAQVVRSKTHMPGRRSSRVEGPAMQRCVRSGEIRAVCTVAIIANALYMGVYAQMQLQALLHGEQPPGDSWEHVETGFCFFFIAELLLRLLGERTSFLKGEEAPWNVFDSFLVALSVVDIILTQFDSLSTLNFTFARTLRIFRFARILRVVRVMRFFYSFRLMVYSVIYSIVSLLWVFIMLLFVMYFFAIFFLHGVADYFKGGTPGSVDEELRQNLELYYGTVPNALQSLFMAISGGIDWFDVKEPLADVSPVYGWVFLFYIFFMVFGVLNVVMASFVDSASQISRKDRELVTQSEMERNKQYAANIRRFFHEADVDKTGTLSWEEFERYLQDKGVQAYFSSFELDVTQARTLFKLLDLDESNDVGIDEFVEGVLRMKGTARSIDVNMLLYETEKMIDRQVDFMVFAEEQFQTLAQAVAPGLLLERPRTSASRQRKRKERRTWSQELQPFTLGPWGDKALFETDV